MDDIIEALLAGEWGLAIGVGVGVGLIMSGGLRSLTKRAIKGYLLATEARQLSTPNSQKGLQDLYAEPASRQT